MGDSTGPFDFIDQPNLFGTVEVKYSYVSVVSKHGCAHVSRVENDFSRSLWGPKGRA